MHTNLILALHSGTLVIKLLKVVLNLNSYCNTTSRSVFVSFAMPKACPLLKLKCFVLLVMHSWLKVVTLIGYIDVKLKAVRPV